MVTAFISFTQGAHTDNPGKAVLGAYGDFSAVTVGSGDNTDVVSWKIFLLDAPSDSTSFPAASQPQILAEDTDDNPTVDFTPDVAGTYRIMLEVVDDLGSVDRDIRCFGIPDARGFVRPPYQQNPEPLPVELPGILTVDPRPIKPDEQNYGANVRGWAGNGGAGQLDDFFERHGDLPFLVVDAPGFVAVALDPPLYIVDMPTIGAPTSFTLPADPREGFVVRIAVLGASDPGLALTVGAQGGGSVGSASTVNVLGDSGIVLVHQGGNVWVILSVTGAAAVDPSPRAPLALDYTFSSSLDDADPGSGYLALSQGGGGGGGQEAASDRLFINLADANGPDWSLFFDQLRAGYIRLESADGTGWIVFEVLSVEAASGYKRMFVSLVQSTDTDPFIHDQPIRVTFDVVRSREAGAIEQSEIGWSPTTASSILTVLTVGHAPGLYGVALACIVTSGGSGGTAVGTVTWTSTFGAESFDTEAIDITVEGSHQIPVIVIRSDGSADVTVQFSGVGEVSGGAIVDIYAGLAVQVLAP